MDFEDGVATIRGNAINQATKDLAVAIAGNVKGVERVVGGTANEGGLGPLAGALLGGGDGNVGVDDVLNLARRLF